MRLMGRSRLARLARLGGDGVSGAVAALCAELEEGRWSSAASVAQAYPGASVDGSAIRIHVGERHCVDLLANYDEEMMLVTFADLAARAPRRHRAKGGKSV